MGLEMFEFSLIFNLATIVNCTLMMLWYFHQKKIPLKSYVFFLRFNIYIFMAAATNTLAGILFKTGAVGEVGYNIIMAFYSFMISFILVVYTAFICEYMNMYDKDKLTIKYFLYFILLCTTSIEFTTPFNKIGYYFYEDGYTAGKLGALYFMLSVVLVVTAAAVIILKRKNIPAFKAFILLSSIVFSVVMMMLQLKYSVSLLCFGFSIVCLSLYNYIFNPALYIDNLTNLFNKECMRGYLSIVSEEINSSRLLCLRWMISNISIKPME